MKNKAILVLLLASESALAHPGHGGPEDLTTFGMLAAVVVALAMWLKR